MERSELIQEFKEQRRLHGLLAKRKLAHFTTYIHDDFEIQWFMKIVFDKLDDWIDGKITKLAIFMPPQHGKSTTSSIITPAKILGMMPNSKIVVASYSDKLASKFNRSCQDIIDSPEFKTIFPGVILPSKGVESTNELRNNTYFETVKHKGFFKAVSINGQLTGEPIDFGIIDDPIKGRQQANSKNYRDLLWSWYQEVFKKRLHNESRQLMLFTRWHEDDLAGRLFNPKSEYYNEEEANEWTVICFQALKEESLPMPMAMKYDDPRELGDALWEEKHSKAKHENTKKTNPLVFASLDQQRPSPATGNIIQKSWFQVIDKNMLPFNESSVVKDFWIDGAFTKDVQNDESAQMSCSFYKGNLYIFNCHGVRKELHEYLQYIVPWLKSSGYRGTSNIFIEMKASGFGFYSMLKSSEHGNHNCRKINSKTVSYGKLTRAHNAQPTLASGKVFLVKSNWNEAFIDQCASFPNDTHDDMLDLLCYAIDEYFINDNEVIVGYS